MIPFKISHVLIIPALLLVLLLTACGGGNMDAPAAAPATAATTAGPAADGTVASDSAQPSDADPPVLRADGSRDGATESGVQAKQARRATVKDSPEAVEVGDILFHDPRLSANGKMACATCHTQDFGHADAPGVKLPKGGFNLDLSGMRSSMTSRYLNLAPPFRLSFFGRPSGGFLWDGRADDRFEQAFHGSPFFNPVEMALPGEAANPKALTDLVRSAPYFAQLEALYVDTPDKIKTDQQLFFEVARLLEIYQRGDPDYNLFDSKFDQMQAGTAAFSPAEQRGWDLFSDPNRGNCTACHTASRTAQSIFTNFGYAALGLPRNHAGPKNADPAFYDLGICSREKAASNSVVDILIRSPRYCGLFKTPTLRNVERTAPYFHNASIDSLEQAVRFHFERDARPDKWYRKADGSPDRRYNDLPWYYRGNLARGKPFDGSFQPSDGDVADILAFLRTLNDADQTAPFPVMK